MRIYAMCHVPHHPPFLEVFERSCAAGARGSGGTGGAEFQLLPVTWLSDMVKGK